MCAQQWRLLKNDNTENTPGSRYYTEKRDVHKTATEILSFTAFSDI